MEGKHRILGQIIDDRLNWKVHLKDVKARAGKRLGLLKILEQTKNGEEIKKVT
jgi:hypothetical protein